MELGIAHVPIYPGKDLKSLRYKCVHSQVHVYNSIANEFEQIAVLLCMETYVHVC